MSPLSFDSLAPETRAAAEDLLGRFESAFVSVPESERADALDDLRAHLLDALGPQSTPADVADVADDLGDPADYARALSGSTEPAPVVRALREGTFLGVPYGLNVPGTDAVAERWWNPRDPRLFVPRVFGVGWDVNFGALAVLLRLIEPDAEDEPFALVPDRAFAGLLVVPVAIAVAFVVLALVTWGSLPPLLATHWNARGVADGWWPRTAALAFSALWVVPPTFWAVWSHITRRRPLSRGVTIAFATLLGVLGAGMYAAAVMEALAGNGAVAVWASLVAGLVLPLIELVYLARVGRAEEWRRSRASDGRGAV